MQTRLPFQTPTQTLEHVLGSDPAVVRGFAQGVFEALAHGPLNLRDRDRLITRGVRLGMKRFDASLVIAAMEQRHRERPTMRLVRHDEPRPGLFRWLPWVAAMSLQGLIAAGAWWVLFA